MQTMLRELGKEMTPGQTIELPADESGNIYRITRCPNVGYFD